MRQCMVNGEVRTLNPIYDMGHTDMTDGDISAFGQRWKSEKQSYNNNQNFAYDLLKAMGFKHTLTGSGLPVPEQLGMQWKRMGFLWE